MTSRLGPGAPAALVVAALLAACGVPVDGEARSLGTPPFGLLTTTTGSTTTTVAPEQGFRLTLYWVGPTEAIVPGEPIGLPEAPTFQAVLDLLVAGPPVTEPEGSTTTTTGPASTETTAPTGLRTYVTESLTPTGVTPAAPGPMVRAVDDATQIVEVVVADDFIALPGGQFRLAVAQMVCTLTQFENARGVRFFDSQGQLSINTVEGVPLDGQPATRENIGTCDPSPPPPPPEETTTTVPTTAARARPTTTVADLPPAVAAP